MEIAKISSTNCKIILHVNHKTFYNYQIVPEINELIMIMTMIMTRNHNFHITVAQLLFLNSDKNIIIQILSMSDKTFQLLHF